MEAAKKKSGRPPLTEGKSSNVINVRLNDKELETLLEMESQLGLTRTEIVKARLFRDADKLLINTREALVQLDKIGAEMNRIGNNINQLARHGNTLNLKGRLHPQIISEFNALFENYLVIQRSLDTSLRKMIRTMGK